MKLRKHLCLSIYFFPLMAFLSGCINSDYDLEKDIDTEITVGQGGLRLPLGSTEPIELNDFISESESIVLENGVYTVQKEGFIEGTELELHPVVVRVPSPFIEPIVVDFNRVRHVSKAQTFEAPIERTSAIQINQPVQPELRFLCKSTFVSPNPILRFCLKFDASLPASVNSMSLKDFRLEFPSFFVFEGVSEEILLNETFNPQDGLVVDLPLKFLDFTHYPAGGIATVIEDGLTYLRVNDLNELSMSGLVSINTSSEDVASLQNVRIIPEVTVEILQLKEVEGKFDPIIEPITEVLDLDLGDDLDFIQEDGMLDFYNPQIKMRVENPVRVPVDADIALRGLNEDGLPITGSEVYIPQIHLRAAQVSGKPLETAFLISKLGTEASGYESVMVPNLSNLFHVVPEKIEMYIDTRLNQNQNHVIDVSGSDLREIRGSYDLYMPMEFEAIEISYREQLEDVSDFLKDLSDNQDDLKLQLLIDTKNAIPLDLVVSMEVLDGSGEVIKSIVSNQVDLIAGDLSTPEKKSVVIEVKIPKGTHVKIDRINLLIEGSGEAAPENIELREDQYVQLEEMELRLYGGLSFEF